MATADTMRLLKSTDDHDVVRGLSHLGARGTIRDVPLLVPLLHHRAGSIRMMAGGIASSLIRVSLLDNFETLTDDERKKLGELLLKLAPDAVHDLARVIYGDDKARALKAIQVFRYCHYDHAIKDLLVSLLKNGSKKIRATAATVLAAFADRNEHGVFFDLLADDDPRVRANAVEAIGSLKDNRLIYLLLRLRSDRDNRTRANALHALYRLGRRGVVADVITMLESHDRPMQLSGLWLVSYLHIPGSELHRLCRELTYSHDPQVAEKARECLH